MSNYINCTCGNCVRIRKDGRAERHEMGRRLTKSGNLLIIDNCPVSEKPVGFTSLPYPRVTIWSLKYHNGKRINK